MTYRELYESATRKLEKSEITLGEYEEMTKPLNEDIREWIPVFERLPEDSQRVNITIQRSHTVYVTTATWDEMRGYFYNLGHAFDDVVAWRELPEPYKAEKGGE